MRVLVTGGMGFVSTPLVRQLADRHAVTIVDRLDFGISPSLKSKVTSSAIDLIEGDLAERIDLHQRLKAGEFDAVAHLAGLHFIPTCEANPVQAYKDNVVALGALLSNCPEGQRFLNISSAAVYRPDTAPHSETAAIGPTDVYGWSKKLEKSSPRTTFENGISRF